MKPRPFSSGVLVRTMRAVLCIVFAFSLFIEAFSHSAYARSPEVISQTVTVDMLGADKNVPSLTVTVDCAVHGCWSLQPAQSYVVAQKGKPLPIQVAPSANNAADVPVSERPPRG